MTFKSGHAKTGGRLKGTPNKATASLRAAILEAGEMVGAGAEYKNGRIIPGKDGLKGYLAEKAITNPELYMPLLARVLPYELTGVGGGPIQHEITGDSTLREAAAKYAQMLKDGSYDVSEEEMEELEGVIENGQVKLLNGPAKAPAKRK